MTFPTGAQTSIVYKKPHSYHPTIVNESIESVNLLYGPSQYLQATRVATIHAGKWSMNMNDLTLRIVQDAHFKGAQFAETLSCAIIGVLLGEVNLLA
jgi:hypothetical protein